MRSASAAIALVANSPDAIEQAGAALVRMLLEVHEISPRRSHQLLDLTGTALRAAFAATGIRRVAGFDRVPLLSTVGFGRSAADTWRLEILVHIAAEDS